MHRLLGYLLGLAFILHARPGVHASPLLELLGSPSGGGFNARVIGTGPDATYFNPALLPDLIESFDVTLMGIGNTFDIDVNDRPAGVDIAPSIYDAWLGDGQGGITPLDDAPLATQDLSPRQADSGRTAFQSYIGLGLVKHIVGRTLVLGVYGAIPTGQLQGHNVFYADEREQYFSNSLRFELYDDRLSLSTFAFALGGELGRMLSLGVGFVGAIETAATTPVYVPDGADLGRVYLAQSLSVDTKLSPHVGAELRPLPHVRLSATVHTPSSVEVRGSNDIQTANGDIKKQEFAFTHGYEPWTLALGTAWDVMRTPGCDLTLVANAAWRNWSSYRDRHSESPRDPWNNTFTVSLGGRYRSGPTQVFADATYVPSPVPTQDGRDNYVDNDRLGLVTGVNSETRLLGAHLTGGFFLQAHRLFRRSVQKSLDAANPIIDEFPDSAVDPAVDPAAYLPEAQGLQTNNPGYPGYSSSGFVLAFGLTVRMKF